MPRVPVLEIQFWRLKAVERGQFDAARPWAAGERFEKRPCASATRESDTAPPEHIAGKTANDIAGASVRVLSVSRDRAQHRALRRFLSSKWRIESAGGYLEAADLLIRDRIAIVICDSNLPDGSWRDLLSNADEYAERMTLIVTAGLPNDRLWAEVLNLGGYDVLARPFDRDEVSRVLASTCGRTLARYAAYSGKGKSK